MTTVPKMSKRAEELVIAQAVAILHKRLLRTKCVMNDPSVVNDYLRVKLSPLEHEVFGVLFLDIQNRLIRDQAMFQGTVSGSAVYPREIVKLGLSLNASRVILYHNHPGGDLRPSGSDMLMTKNLKEILTTVDIMLLDHVIVAGLSTFSFKAGGLL